MHPPEGPPVSTPLQARSPGIPPPISNMISRRVMPIGTSMSPALLTAPARDRVLVPLLLPMPIELYQSPPRFIMADRLAKVSTLFMFVGLDQSPALAGNGGLVLGIPLCPSIEAMSAVSSPQTKAPAPSLMVMSKSIPDPRMSSPSRP